MKIFISAGDPSGDIHAAKLMKEIRRRVNNVQFVGIGGSEMTKEGLSSLIPISDISVLGFWEVAKKFNKFIALLNRCKAILQSQHIDLFLPIDYPGLNLKLAEEAKRLSIPVIYYIAPQLWAWGKNRTGKIREFVDKLLVVFPFEEEFFKADGIDASYVGNPLLDIPELKANFKSREQREDIVALFPGSREQEVIKHLDILVKTAEILHNSFPNFQFAIAKSSNIKTEIYREKINNHKYLYLSEDNRELMLNAKVGIIKSGTSNLEACISGLPFSLIYKTSPLTYFIGKRKINMPYLSIVNILANKNIVKEFIQKQANPTELALSSAELINSKEMYNSMQNEFQKIKEVLGNKSATETVASIILNAIK